MNQLFENQENVVPLIWQGDTAEASPGYASRGSMYGVSSLPHTQFGGYLSAVGGGAGVYNNFLQKYNQIIGTDSPAEIEVSLNMGTNNSLLVEADINLTGDISTSNNRVVFVLTRHITNSYFASVVGYEHIEFDLSTSGESGTYSQELAFDESWDLTNIKAIVMVQTFGGNKEILQAAQTGFSGTVPLFTSSIQSGPPALTVEFSDSSLPSGGIEGWQWDLDGDGEFDSTEQNPSFTYTTPGSYDIRLEIFDGTEYVESTIEDYITVLEPGTPFSGKLAGSWSPQYNPYIISANATVESGDMLQIASGTEVVIQAGGILIYGEISSLAEADNKTSFTSDSEWSGIRVIGAEATASFLHNKFSSATEAAISFEDGPSGLVQECLFTDNHSSAKAAAIEIANSDQIDILQNVIHNNSSTSGPAGIACLGADPQIKNNLIYANTANFGAFAFKNESVPVVINNTIANNSSDSALMIIFNSWPIIRNNIMRDEAELALIINSEPEFTYNNLSAELDGTGNINADPLFVDAEIGNYQLAENSPCIDAGDPAAEFNDPDGSINDMGAWGGALALDGVPLDAEEEIIPSLDSMAISIYPNPFGAAGTRTKGKTTISFDLPENSQNNSLEIYNLRGQKIRTWQLAAKQTTQIWDGKDQNRRPLPNGLYLIKLQSEQRVAVQKAILLK